MMAGSLDSSFESLGSGGEVEVGDEIEDDVNEEGAGA
jgi:hypothetical protein